MDVFPYRVPILALVLFPLLLFTSLHSKFYLNEIIAGYFSVNKFILVQFILKIKKVANVIAKYFLNRLMHDVR